MSRAARAATLLCVCTAVSIPSLNAQGVLRRVDSVRVQESGNFTVGTIGGIAPGAKGDLFAVDNADVRVLHIAKDGRLIKTLGRNGEGPGEFRNPFQMVAAGDSVLWVYDSAMQRFVLFDQRTGKYREFVSAGLRNPSLVWTGREMLATKLDAKSFTALVTVTPSGVSRPEGQIAAIGRKLPIMLNDFSATAFALRGNQVWMASELSQSLLTWTRGSTTATEFPLTVTQRHGVNTAHYEEMVRDPSSAPRVARLHSRPRAMQFISPDILALLTLDQRSEKGVYKGPYHLSLVDVNKRQICPDVKLPYADEPLPRVTMSRDTVIVVVQDADNSGELITSIIRYAIDPRQCKWSALPGNR